MEFLVLGPLEVRGAAGRIELRSGRQRALLALLLRHAGEVVSKGRLVRELWGDEPPSSAEHALEVHISGLRATIGRDLIETRPSGYALAEGLRSYDLARFELLATGGEAAADSGDTGRARTLLQAALDLWRGEPLEDVAADVALPERTRLESMRDYVTERLLDVELAAGRHLEVLPQLRSLARAHPLWEGVHERLMLALYRAGRQAEALDAYQHARRALDEELGVEPGPGLSRLQSAILTGDPSLAPSLPAQATGIDAMGPRVAREILVIHRQAEPIDAAARIASALASAGTHSLVLASLTERDPEALPRAYGALVTIRDTWMADGVTARVAAHTTDDWAGDLAELAGRLDVDLVALAIGSVPAGFDEPLRKVLRLAACDVILVPSFPAVGDERPLLVPFGGSDHDWLALETGAWLARASGRELWIAGRVVDGAVDGDGSDTRRRDASRLLADASLLLQRVLGVDAHPRLTNEGVEGIIRLAGEAGLVLAGLSDDWETEGLGAHRLALAERSPVPVLFGRRGVRPGGLAPDAALTRFSWSAAPRGE